MAVRLEALVLEALDPQRLAAFWGDLLGWEVEGTRLHPTDDTGFDLRFVPTDEPKRGPNMGHFDITSQSLEQQQETVARVIALGGGHLDIGQGEVDHVVMQDPEGNEMCVIEPGNSFLADCGFIGALSGEGTQALGYFWAAALDYPLVWDQDEETAVRSPQGGPKLTWGGPPLNPATHRHRFRWELSTDDPDRLVALGARRVDGRTWLDPDGNEFWATS